MKTICKSFDVYPFIELTEDAQNKAINDHINFWLEIKSYEDEPKNSNFKKACDKAESMQTPWFAPCYVYDYCKDEIIEEIEINEYVFTAEGHLFND